MASSCHRHLLGFNKVEHKLYEGSEKSHCSLKYGGTLASTIISLTRKLCQRHPIGTGNGKHAPAL